MLIYLQRIESNDDKAKFEQIYLAYKGLMYHIAYKRLEHQQDAEDVVQHVFMKIAENIEKIEPVSPKTKQLVVTMVENRIIDLYRVRGRHPVVSFEDEISEYLSTQPDEEDLLTQCIFKLPDQQRQVIWLKYHHGYDLHEISALLGISLSWAQKIDQRAKKALEALYKEAGGEF